jgi:hypothetical protein
MGDVMGQDLQLRRGYLCWANPLFGWYYRALRH